MDQLPEGKQQPNGYVLLLSVLVIGAVVLSISLSVIILSLDSHLTSMANLQSRQARGLADACAEQALEAIRADENFSGTGNLTLGQGSCSYTVSNLGGESRNIESYGTVNDITRRVEVDISQIYNTINISSWQEVSSF